MREVVHPFWEGARPIPQIFHRPCRKRRPLTGAAQTRSQPFRPMTSMTEYLKDFALAVGR